VSIELSLSPAGRFQQSNLSTDLAPKPRWPKKDSSEWHPAHDHGLHYTGPKYSTLKNRTLCQSPLLLRDPIVEQLTTGRQQSTVTTAAHVAHT